jgi:Mycothiol maleylpyruvate isomerase N-terminal domain
VAGEIEAGETVWPVSADDRHPSGWGPTTYGDPCAECGFSWSADLDDSVALVATIPTTYTRMLQGASGGERPDPSAWTTTAYVSHVGDNLRIWAERLAGIVRGGSPDVAGYDQDALAAARGYESISLPSALWSLSRSVDDWLGVVTEALPLQPVLVHPERGPQSLVEVVRSNAHDAFHHQWDIQRALDGAQASDGNQRSHQRSQRS